MAAAFHQAWTATYAWHKLDPIKSTDASFSAVAMSHTASQANDPYPNMGFQHSELLLLETHSGSIQTTFGSSNNWFVQLLRICQYLLWEQAIHTVCGCPTLVSTIKSHLICLLPPQLKLELLVTLPWWSRGHWLIHRDTQRKTNHVAFPVSLSSFQNHQTWFWFIWWD